MKKIMYRIWKKLRLIKYRGEVEKILRILREIKELDDEQLKKLYFKSLEIQNNLTLIAVVGEAFRRIYNIKIHKSQYLAVSALLDNNLTEVKTGEGKTFIIAILALTLKGKVHISTVNRYLAERDYKKLEELYLFFNRKCYYNDGDRDPEKIKQRYDNDIIYSASQDLVFDYLSYGDDILGFNFEFPFENVIIDEFDFVLLDNANSEYSVSTGLNYEEKHPYFYKVINELSKSLKGLELSREQAMNISYEDFPDDYDYYYNIAERMILLTDKCYNFIDNLFNLEGVSFDFRLNIYKILYVTLEAQLFLKNGEDYLVKDNKIVLVNKVNGRLMDNSYLENDLHNAIEIKEGIEQLTPVNRLDNTINYQLFYSKYKNLYGLSGTLLDALEELEETYRKGVLEIPLNKTLNRKDYRDMLFKTREEKYNYIVEVIKYRKDKRPILIIAESDLECERICDVLLKNNIEHQKFNNNIAYNLEADIVEKIGEEGKITVSTSLIGRGTDILLKSNTVDLGLLLISATHFISRRVDNQVRGRVGRHGEPGITVFISSLEDNIYKFALQKDINELTKLVNKKYLSKKDIKKLDIIRKIQDNEQYKSSYNRKINYRFDKVLELKKQDIVNKREEFKKRFYEWAYEVLNYDIKELEIEQGEYYRLLERAIDDIYRYKWLLYNKNMRDVRYYVMMYLTEATKIYLEYIKIVDEEYNNMLKDVENDLKAFVKDFIDGKVNIPNSVMI